jgi:SAM-dependent methyltransferase
MWLLLAFALCVTVGVLVFLFDSAVGGQDFASDSATERKVVSLIVEGNLSGGKFYDLGSAHGGFDIKIAGALPLLQVVGLDNDPFRIFFSRARSLFFKNLKFVKADIFKTDLSDAAMIYVYLPQEIMPKLENKLNELKPGVIVVTNKVNFPNWKPVKKIDKLFVYVKE